MMKKLLLFLTLLFAMGFSSYAQRFAYVDTEYILSQVPQYSQAQKQLDAFTAGWNKEIEAKYKEIDDMYKAFQAEQVLLTPELRKKREQEIVDKEQAVKELQKKRFGYQGDIFQKRQELIKPVQDKVYEEVQKISTSRNYDFIFDKSGGLTMLYANPKMDVSDDVLRAMGITPKKN